MRFKAISLSLLGTALAGCAGTQPQAQHPAASSTALAAQGTPATPPAPGSDSQTSIPRQIIIYIPQNDQGVVAWLKLFEKYPNLRMVVALSPRFQRFTKEPPLKEQVLALQKAGRLELALQLPNAPFLPLLINTDAAKEALPAGSSLPTPPFTYPEDAVQVVAKAKADFYKMWGQNPKGLILPHGAADAPLLKLLNQVSLGWIVGALGAPSTGGAYRAGSLLAFDATPAHEDPRFMVLVWDERVSGNPAQSIHTLNTWAQNIGENGMTAALPGDPNIPAQDLSADAPWGHRTWSTSDWSAWIGGARKNAAWSWLRTTRQALENFKNSGQASVRRLDMGFEEIYNAENANYFSGITEGDSTFHPGEEREREFQATLSSVYRLIGQTPPDNLFDMNNTSTLPGASPSSTTVTWEALPEGRGHLTIDDAPNDDHGDGQLTDPGGDKAVPGTYDLRRIEVAVSAETLDWTVTLGAINASKLGTFQTPGPLIDIYLDLNGQPGVGSVSLLPGRGATASASDAWEYAVALWGTQAQFFRTRGTDNFEMTDTLPLTFDGNQIRFSIPRAWLRGNPQRWGYQALVTAYDPQSLESSARPLVTPAMAVAHRLPIIDLIDPLSLSQATLLTAIETGKRNDIPFVRPRSLP